MIIRRGVVLRADLLSKLNAHAPVNIKTLITVSVNDPRIIQLKAAEIGTVVTISYFPEVASANPNWQSENNPYYLQQDLEREAEWLVRVNNRS